MFFINHTEINEGSGALIEIEGHLNSTSSQDFEEYLLKLLDKNVRFFLIDMGNLDYISSEGIGAALLIQKNINESNGYAVLCNLNKEIAGLFRLLGFDRVFSIAGDRAEAISALDRHMELKGSGIKTDHRIDIMDIDQIEETPAPDIHPDEISINDELTGDEIDLQFEDISEPQFEPFVIECLKCSSLIRITEPGECICPFCGAEFTVADDKKAIFQTAGPE